MLGSKHGERVLRVSGMFEGFSSRSALSNRTIMETTYVILNFLVATL